jgi:hypothetical protein
MIISPFDCYDIIFKKIRTAYVKFCNADCWYDLKSAFNKFLFFYLNWNRKSKKWQKLGSRLLKSEKFSLTSDTLSTTAILCHIMHFLIDFYLNFPYKWPLISKEQIMRWGVLVLGSALVCLRFVRIYCPILDTTWSLGFVLYFYSECISENSFARGLFNDSYEQIE